MWTLQEFCASSQLIIAKQTGDDGDGNGDSEDDMHIAKDLEAVHAEAQRAKHIESQGNIEPLWLLANIQDAARDIPPDVAKITWKAFQVLSSKRNCMFPSDRVQAL